MSDSLADKFVQVANEIARIDEGVDNDNPHRYPLRGMKETANSVLFDAMRHAQRIADLAKVLKQEIAERNAMAKP